MTTSILLLRACEQIEKKAQILFLIRNEFRKKSKKRIGFGEFYAKILLRTNFKGKKRKYYLRKNEINSYSFFFQ
jgi:hypothetical protein